MEFIEANKGRFTIFRTKSREEAIELTARFVEENEKIVVVAGGDGTLNAVIEGLAGSETTLGVFPTGTMNVFAREMGIPFDSLEKSLGVIDAGHKKRVDIFQMNSAAFVQMAGVGFDAQVIEATSWESKKKLGPLSYLLSVGKVLRENLPVMNVRAEDGTEVEGIALFVGNGMLYGGHFPLFRSANNHDGLMDVIVFKKAGFQFIRDSLRGLLKGGVDPLSPGGSVKYLQTASLRVTSAEEIPVEIDGELWGRSREIDFCSSGKQLSVFVPEDPASHRGLKIMGGLNPFHRSDVD